MLPRQSFRLKPVGGFRAAKVLWLAALLLAFFSDLASIAACKLLRSSLSPSPVLFGPSSHPPIRPGTDTGFDDVVEPNEGGMEEVPLGQAGESPAAPDEELDDNQPLKPDLKLGGEGVGNPQSTEENKQDRLGPKQDTGPVRQSGTCRCWRRSIATRCSASSTTS